MTTMDQLNARGRGCLPGLIGIEFISIEPGQLQSRLTIRPELLALNGYLHAATIVALADTTCGYGTINSLPDGACQMDYESLHLLHEVILLRGALCQAVSPHGIPGCFR
ncbi:MAG: PaaI family thioesterase [Chloroflexota bacterium]